MKDRQGKGGQRQHEILTQELLRSAPGVPRSSPEQPRAPGLLYTAGVRDYLGNINCCSEAECNETRDSARCGTQIRTNMFVDASRWRTSPRMHWLPPYDRSSNYQSRMIFLYISFTCRR